MIGKIIRERRKELGISLTYLAGQTGINIGHLSHIEKGERNPSRKALKQICDVLNMKASQVWNYSDAVVEEEKGGYIAMKYTSLNRVPVVKVKDYVFAPKNYDGNVIAVIMPDDSMENIAKKGEYVYVDLNTSIENNDVILAKYNKKIIVRKYKASGSKIKLIAYNKEYSDISIDNQNGENDLDIIGKVILEDN